MPRHCNTSRDQRALNLALGWSLPNQLQLHKLMATVSKDLEPNLTETMDTMPWYQIKTIKSVRADILLASACMFPKIRRSVLFFLLPSLLKQFLSSPAISTQPYFLRLQPDGFGKSLLSVIPLVFVPLCLPFSLPFYAAYI